MAALSPAVSNNSSENAGAAAITAGTGVTTAASPTKSSAREPPKTLRGLNKPKCIKCGNVARSRCPYQSCKSCCAKAQNPCYIHVLKTNATSGDKTPSGSAVSEQQQNEAPSSGSSHKGSSLRQLSSNFSQFNSLHIPFRSRKPLTKKDALAINEWRFSKLKEFIERNIEAENEAFDRYIQNIGLLEEIFHVHAEDPVDENSSLVSNPPTSSGDKIKSLLGTKLKLRSNLARIDGSRKRIQTIVDQGLRKLQKYSSIDSNTNSNDEANFDPKMANNVWSRKSSALSELNDKLNRARNEEDLKLCMQIWSRITSQMKTESAETPNDYTSGQESDQSMLKLVKSTEIDRDILDSVDSYFSSLEEIEDL